MPDPREQEPETVRAQQNSEKPPPGARALLDEAVEKGAKAVPRLVDWHEQEELATNDEIATAVLTAAGFPDLAARAERAERELAECSDALNLVEPIAARADAAEREVERLNCRNERREVPARSQEVGDGLADALEEARRCEWSHPNEVERDAIVENADEWIEKAHAFGWGAACAERTYDEATQELAAELADERRMADELRREVERLNRRNEEVEKALRASGSSREYELASELVAAEREVERLSRENRGLHDRHERDVETMLWWQAECERKDRRIAELEAVARGYVSRAEESSRLFGLMLPIVHHVAGLVVQDERGYSEVHLALIQEARDAVAALHQSRSSGGDVSR